MKNNHVYKYSNGDVVTETITGFTGTIVGSVHYLTGCNQYLVAAKAKDNFTEAISNWYDEGRLTIIESQKITKKDVEGKKNGCDRLPNKY